MAVSKYERYIVRKPGVLKRLSQDEYIDEIPATDIIPNMSSINTGPRIIYSSDLVKNAHTKVEYGFIMGDTVVGNGQDFDPHKHDYEEIFLFLGTDPHNTADLGAEVEFWLGEGKDLEKVVFNTSSSVFVPPGSGPFPAVLQPG